MPRGDADLHVHSTSRGLDARSLEPGRHAVLDIPVSHGASLRHGILIDDHLDARDRASIDAAAMQAIGRWHERYDDMIKCGSLSIADVWHSELFAEVFLPGVKIVRGLRRTIEATGARRLVGHKLDPELIDALRVALAPAAVEVHEAGPLEPYPGEDAAPQGAASRSPWWSRAIQSMLSAAGAPSFVRGQVIVVPYYSTLTVLEHLAAGDGPAPVVYAPFPPPPAVAARAAARGGWIGLPGARRMRRAERHLVARLDTARGTDPAGLLEPGVDELLHRRALRCLASRAVPTAAQAPLLERELSRGRVRLVLVPFDHEPVAKVLLSVAQACGVPVLSLQHGYEVDKVAFYPGELADAAGQWSRWDVEALPANRQAVARVIGNPSRGNIRTHLQPRSESPQAVILVEHRLRNTTQASRRITAEHLAVAFAGLQQSRYRWRITVRPHPADDVAQFRLLTTELARDHLDPGAVATVDATTPLLELLDTAELCVGARSTAALQTVLTGTRLVMLAPEPLAMLPPLDGGGAVLSASTAAELAEAVDTAMDSAELPGRDELLEALGHTPEDPTRTVLRWMDELIQGARPTGMPAGARS